MNVSNATSSLPAIGGVPLAASRPATEPVSVAGVMLLSAVAVALTIIGVLLLGVTLLGAWWLIRHIPVPAFVSHMWTVAQTYL